MNIAVVHYHLKPGGVTRVIEQQLEIFRAKGWNCVVLTGENPSSIADVVVIPELHYDDNRRHGADVDAGELAELMLAGAREHLDGEPDLIHVHNATLAKNALLLPALNVMETQGVRLCLQLHDFAEDGRPGVYSPAPYPSSVHYVCINQRDFGFLKTAGTPEARMHMLPNLVSPLPGASDNTLPKAAPAVSKGAKRYALYPVRGIRRKNLGEALLLSILCEDLEVGITLPPNNPIDRPSYDGWKSLAAELHAPMHYEVAATRSFEECLQSADIFISTSIQEGFGFAFLEPWTLNKPVAGRVIPYVFSDFADAGMKMPWFYQGLPISTDMLDIDGFRENWLSEAERRLSSFRIALRNQNLEEAASRIQDMSGTLDATFHKLYGQSDTVDFGRLDRENQEQVIRMASIDSQVAADIRNSSPILLEYPFNGSRQGSSGVTTMSPEAIIANNARVVGDYYGEASYASRLEALYQSVLSADQVAPGSPDKVQLLFSFLDPANLFLAGSQ